jgi:hypothetical protein
MFPNSWMVMTGPHSRSAREEEYSLMVYKYFRHILWDFIWFADPEVRLSQVKISCYRLKYEAEFALIKESETVFLLCYIFTTWKNGRSEVCTAVKIQAVGPSVKGSGSQGGGYWRFGKHTASYLKGRMPEIACRPITFNLEMGIVCFSEKG